MMKIYGVLPNGREQADFAEVSSIAIALTPEAMEKFARFVAHAASEMQGLGDAYDHLHFMDFCKDWDETWPDVQLTRVYENKKGR